MGLLFTFLSKTGDCHRKSEVSKTKMLLHKFKIEERDEGARVKTWEHNKNSLQIIANLNSYHSSEINLFLLYSSHTTGVNMMYGYGIE